MDMRVGYQIPDVRRCFYRVTIVKSCRHTEMTDIKNYSDVFPVYLFYLFF